MPSVTTFFRHCPSCGRRFEVRLVNKKLASTEREAYETTSGGTSSTSGIGAKIGYDFAPRSPGVLTHDGYVVLNAKVRVTVERKEFQYAYKCGHCGHQWIEKKAEETEPRVEQRSSW